MQPSGSRPTRNREPRMSTDQPTPPVEVVRYTYRLRPGRQAERYLLDEWDKARWCWNEAISADRDYRHYGASLSGNRMCNELTKWRAANPWLDAGSQNAQQNMVLKWGRARFRKGHRPPRRKSKRWTLPSLEYTKRGFGLVEVDGRARLRLPGKVLIPVVWHRDLPSEPTSVVVYRDAVGHWWASFVVRREVEQFPAPTNDGIGVDWGVTTTATTTDPAYDLLHAEHGKRAAQRLARYQRQMARRKPKRGQPASNGYLSAKQKAAKEHARIRRQRRHDAIQWARAVASDHETIAVEDFRPKFLAKSTMARKAADGRIGAAKTTLIEYGQRAGRAVVLVPPAYTTMTCGECGATRTKRIPLHCRTFHCLDCGHTADRDRNAARTILAAAESNGASVDSRRHRDLLPGPVQLELESPRL